MDWDRIQQKLHILSDAAKYDVSCSSSGSRRANQAGGIGNGAVCGICHTWSADGRCVSLLKILMTNRCIYDCAYCVNAASREAERAILTPEEIADVTIAFYRRNYIEGLFLSSGVYRSPDYTTELLIRTARILRDEKKFNGYIHMKGIPGTSAQLIRELGRYVDRLSVNIELPSAPSLSLLAPQKTRENILVPMGHIRQGILERREEKKHHKKAPSFVPAGQTTQLIVGATPDSDRTILRLSQALYDKVELKRVYYSAYVPAVTGPNLPAIAKPPLLREHRLYQADWLLRFYQFKADEILADEAPDFDLDLDPKACWALRHPEFFPVEVNRASYHALLRVPGIGVTSARRICAARRQAFLSYDTLRRLGIVLKRAQYFITCKGKYYGATTDPVRIRQLLLAWPFLSSASSRPMTARSGASSTPFWPNVGPSPAITYTMPSWPKKKGEAWPSCSICAGRSGISTSFYTISARNPSGRSASGPAGPVMNAINSWGWPASGSCLTACSIASCSRRAASSPSWRRISSAASRPNAGSYTIRAAASASTMTAVSPSW